MGGRGWEGERGGEYKAERRREAMLSGKVGVQRVGRCAPRIHQHHLIFLKVIMKYFRHTGRYKNNSFDFKQYGRDTFLKKFLLSTAKSIEIIYKTKVRLRVRRKKADHLRTLEPE